MDQITETSPGSSESILALGVGAAVGRAGADGGVFDSVRPDTLLLFFRCGPILVPHTEDRKTAGQRSTTTKVINAAMNSEEESIVKVIISPPPGVVLVRHLLTQPLLTTDSAVSLSDRELQDLLSCQEPPLASLPVSELFLLATTGPGPDPRLSALTLGPPASEGTLSPPDPSGSLPESLLVRPPFRLSEEDTWLIRASGSSAEETGPIQNEFFLLF